jgi:hypothetical protein
LGSVLNAHASSCSTKRWIGFCLPRCALASWAIQRAGRVIQSGGRDEKTIGGAAGCTQLNDAFRVDAGAVEFLRELLNARFFPFCNQRFAGDTTPVEYPLTLVSSDPTFNGAPIFADVYQDFDPIRRHCDGDAGGGADLPNRVTTGSPFNLMTTQSDYPAFVAEQVCGPQNTLGLVLAVLPPTINSNPQAADLYPTKALRLSERARLPLCSIGQPLTKSSKARLRGETRLWQAVNA